MTKALIVLGALIGLAGLLAAVLPSQVMRIARNVTINTPLRIATFLIRSALGAFFILVSPSTDFPLTLTILGILSIVAGLVPLAMGNAGSQSLLNWVLERAPSSIVLAGLAGGLLGAFLIYAGT